MAHILVLDDEPKACNLIKKVLEKGNEVYTFTEEDDAINHAMSSKVDLAILDIKLKKMSGVEVLAELKKYNPEIRAIMLTGYPTTETAKEAITLGATEYLVKPIDIDELENTAKRTLAARKPSKETISIT
ncbi:MAG: response regulator [Deltaproteobacteria bacterium]|nr:response regulator [Deltaproteobacteria bacterium]MBW2070762.1 response regulator [Deltaproteobacteria bacterium]